MKSFFKKIPWPLWIIALVILINVVLFQPIRHKGGPLWTVQRLPSSNIFDEQIISANESKRTNSLYKMFFVIGEEAPGYKFIVPKNKNPFGRGTANRAKLFILGHAAGVRVTTKPLNYDSLLQSVSGEFQTYSGSFLPSVAAKRSGKPPLEWQILIPKQGSSKEFLYIRDEANTKWLFVDTSLLPASILNGIEDD